MELLFLPDTQQKIMVNGQLPKNARYKVGSIKRAKAIGAICNPNSRISS